MVRPAPESDVAGPRNGSMAEITASPRIRRDVLNATDWRAVALFHLLDAFTGNGGAGASTGGI